MAQCSQESPAHTPQALLCLGGRHDLIKGVVVGGHTGVVDVLEPHNDGVPDASLYSRGHKDKKAKITW